MTTKLAFPGHTLAMDGGPRSSRPAFYACMLFVSVSVGRITELLPFLAPLQLGNVGALLLLLSILSAKKHKLAGLMDNRLSVPIFIFIAFVIISIFYSAWRGASFYYITTVLPIPVVLYIGLAKTIGDPGDLRKIIYIVIVSALAFSLKGVALDWGERVEIDSLFDINEMALFLCCVLPFMLAEATLVDRKWLKLALIGAALCAVLMMILTQSRGGFLALCIVGLIIVLFSGFRLDARPAILSVRVRRAVLLGVAALIMILVAPEGAKDRLMSVTELSSDYNVVSDKEGRIAIWSRGLNYLKRHPWGAGVASYPKIDLIEGGQFRAPHNSFVQVLVEIGVIGFIVYMVCIKRSFGTLRTVSRALRSRRDSLSQSRPAIVLYAYSQALYISLVAFCVAGFFLSYGYSVLLFLLFGLIGQVDRLGRLIVSSEPENAAADRS